MKLALIGVPYTSAGLTSGEARAPAVLRAAGLLESLRQWMDVADYGDVSMATPTTERDPVSGIIAPATLATMNGAVRAAVDRAIDEGRLPLVIGGECPLLLGCLAAARDAYGRAGLLFVDGHEDAWPPWQSTTGEAADMELGLALGLTSVQGIAAVEGLLPLVSPEDTIVLGPRDAEELAAAVQPSIAPVVTFMDDRALRQGDLAATAAAMTRKLDQGAGRWWFHLDLDVLTTEALPAVRYPQRGGIAWADLETITAAALREPGLIGWDVTIYNPDLDPDGRGAARIVAFLGDVTRIWASS